MPYYLKPNATNQYVTMPAPVNIASGTDYVIAVKFSISSISTSTRIIGNQASLGSRINIELNGASVRVEDSSRSAIVISIGYTLAADQIYDLKLERIGGTTSIYIDDAIIGSSSNASGSFAINQIFRHNTFNTQGIWDLYSLNINDQAIYDPSASNGTGSTLIDTVGGNDGTLVNFPTDNSQWVFYGAPSSDVNSTISATWPSLAISATQQSTAPAIESSVNVTWPSLAIAASQTAQAPEFSSTVAVQWPSLSVQADQQSAVPEYESTAAITWPSFAINASQGAQVPDVDSSAAVAWPSLSISANQSQQLPEGATTVSIDWPSFTAQATQSSTVPVFTSEAAFTWPSLSVGADQSQQLPTSGASVNIQWPSFSVNASQESTIPEYTSTIAVTWPMFSVSIFAGEFDYFSDPTARIDLPFESRRIDLPFESRRIDL